MSFSAKQMADNLYLNTISLDPQLIKPESATLDSGWKLLSHKTTVYFDIERCLNSIWHAEEELGALFGKTDDKHGSHLKPPMMPLDSEGRVGKLQKMASNRMD